MRHAVLLLLACCVIECCFGMNQLLFGTMRDDDQRLTDIDAWAGKKHVLVHRFGCFDQTEGYTWYNWVVGEMLDSWNNGRVTHFSMDPFDCAVGSGSGDSGTQVIAGQYDASINKFVTMMSTFLSGPDGVLNTVDDRRLYFRWAHELNGNWYSWSSNETSFILCWRYMWHKFNDAGLNNRVLSWVWEPVAPYAPDVAHNFYSYYPGDQYVDWLSLDGYNWARTHSYGQAWYDPWEIYDDMLFNLRDLNASKPIMISEVGCSAHGSTVPHKNQWLIDWFQYAADMNIAIIMYFNTDADGADWTVFGVGTNGTGTFAGANTTYNVYSGYVTASQTNAYTLTSPSNTRILTDDEWWGRLPGYNVRPTPRPKILFDDALKNDWKLANAGCSFSASETSTVYSGAYSIKIDYTAPNWNGVQLAHAQMGFNSSHYYGVQFNFNPGVMPVSNYKNLNWQIYNESGTVISNIYFSGVVTLQPNTWSMVTLPFATNGVPLGMMILGQYIRYMGNGNQTFVYLDNVQLLPNNFTWPADWPVSLPTTSTTSTSTSLATTSLFSTSVGSTTSSPSAAAHETVSWFVVVVACSIFFVL